MPPSPLRRVDRSLLRDEAYVLLRDAIVAGDLAPGEIIRDVELAERVGLSRTPVREALARLTDEGLVEAKPHSWTRVTPLVVRDVRDAHVVVCAMHELAVREAVPVMSEADIGRMREANAAFAAALDAGDVAAALASDDALHHVPVAVAGNRALAATIERHLPLIRRLERLRFASLPGRRSIAMHDRLIDACAAGDVAAAVALTRENWTTLGELLEREGETEST
jgi:DNA-binding GntR family transcriptional regulator